MPFGYCALHGLNTAVQFNRFYLSCVRMEDKILYVGPFKRTAMDEPLEIQDLQLRINDLELKNSKLRSELDFLKLHPAIAQGIKGETLVLQLVEGAITSYSASYDICTTAGLRIEVKYSKLNRPMKVAPTLRWNWSKPLGWLDKGKDYHYLLLVGEKDPRYLEQYPDRTPYVYFLVPLQEVGNVMDQGRTIGGSVQITTNLAKLQTKSNRPKRHLH